MFTPSTRYTRPLGDNLVLKSVGSLDDVERVSAFNGIIHGEMLTPMSRELIMRHPNTHPEHWLFIENETTEQVVSALCLIPWRWRYEDVELKAGEMGIVGTLESYRRRGLIRALDSHFKELLREGEYDLSQIQGIPYFYRQLGYEYAIPLEGGHRVDLHTIPDELPESKLFSFREATADDIPLLMPYYDAASATLSISAVRDEVVWRYLLGPANVTEMSAGTWLVLNKSGQPVGYYRVAHHGFGEALLVSENSLLSHAAAVAVLAHCKRLAQERSKPFIRLNMHPGSVLVETARRWGASDLGMYAWQIHLPDVARLLRKLAPIFERRIAASSFAGLTDRFVINLYREALELCFEAGKVIAVNALGFGGEEGGISIPPLVFAQLVLGYRTHQELRATYPDVGCWGQSAYLADVLFPKVESYIYTIY